MLAVRARGLGHNLRLSIFYKHRPLTTVSSAKRVGTHDGTFHCDEALACFILRLTNAFSNAQIVRTRDSQVFFSLSVFVHQKTFHFLILAAFFFFQFFYVILLEISFRCCTLLMRCLMLEACMNQVEIVLIITRIDLTRCLAMASPLNLALLASSIR